MREEGSKTAPHNRGINARTLSHSDETRRLNGVRVSTNAHASVLQGATVSLGIAARSASMRGAGAVFALGAWFSGADFKMNGTPRLPFSLTVRGRSMRAMSRADSLPSASE